AAGPQHPADLGERGAVVLEVLEQAGREHEVEGLVGEGEALHVADDVRARTGREIQADRALADAPAARPEVGDARARSAALQHPREHSGHLLVALPGEARDQTVDPSRSVGHGWARRGSYTRSTGPVGDKIDPDRLRPLRAPHPRGDLLPLRWRSRRAEP